MDDNWVVYLLTYDMDSRVDRNEDKKALQNVLKHWGAVPICKSVWLIKSTEFGGDIIYEEICESVGFSKDSIFNDRIFFTQITGITDFKNVMCDDDELVEYFDEVKGIRILWAE